MMASSDHEAVESSVLLIRLHFRHISILPLCLLWIQIIVGLLSHGNRSAQDADFPALPLILMIHVSFALPLPFLS